MPSNYGATTNEWVTFDILLGLTQDLLPVVSNPQAEISPNSKMKDKGKTPSRYNRSRMVAGIPRWSQHTATSDEVLRWMKETDYGICLQTREIRAFDIDLAEPEKAARVRDLILSHIMGALPERVRANSGKLLLAFKLPGEYAKRVIKTPYGNIEFLATGQQFIACGTHPSGARYEWREGSPKEFPILPAEKFEAIWADLIKHFAIEHEQPGRERGVRKAGQDIAVPDAILDMLDVISWGNQGQAFIECPFSDEHTSDSGETECCYFPKGTRGYEQGHFKCMHAHCEDRDDSEFEEALGIRDNDLESIPDDAVIIAEDGTTEVLPPERPNFRRTKIGVLAVIDNLLLAVARPDVCGLRVAYDAFRDDIMVAWPDQHSVWRPLLDRDYTFMQNILERKIGFRPIGLESLRRAVESVAMENIHDSATDWLVGIKWDGKPRVDSFMQNYMGAQGGAYARSVGRYLWTALAGRTMRPGIKADMVPIFVGEQGIMKSSAVAAFAPHRDSFVNVNFNESDDNLSRKMRGKQVAEIGELRGLHTKELEAIKEWVAKTHDEWIPKFKERRVVFPRRLIFIGTTNSQEILADMTGNRRWLPIECSKIDINRVIADRDQLWAEGCEIFMKSGIAFNEAEKLSKDVHDNYMVIDPWEEFIREWLYSSDEMDNTTPAQRSYLTINEVLQNALRIEVKTLRGSLEGKRIAGILRKFGYKREKCRVGGGTLWVWVKVATPGADLC